VFWYSLSDAQDVSMLLIAERLIKPLPARRQTLTLSEMSKAKRRPGCGTSSSSSKVESDAREYASEVLERRPGLPSSGTSSCSLLPPADNAVGEERTTYMRGEAAMQLKEQGIRFKSLHEGRKFHLYCSPNNVANPYNACDVGAELQATAADVRWTDQEEHLGECDRMLIHLHAMTWSAEGSTKLALEVARAMRMGVDLLLLHEVIGCDREKRHACAFGLFFDVTPKHLLQAGVYNRMIALNLSGGEWRQAGLIRAAQRVAQTTGSRQPVEVPEIEIDETLPLHHNTSLKTPILSLTDAGSRGRVQPADNDDDDKTPRDGTLSMQGHAGAVSRVVAFTRRLSSRWQRHGLQHAVVAPEPRSVEPTQAASHHGGSAPLATPTDGESAGKPPGSAASASDSCEGTSGALASEPSGEAHPCP